MNDCGMYPETEKEREKGEFLSYGSFVVSSLGKANIVSVVSARNQNHVKLEKSDFVVVSLQKHRFKKA